MLEWLGHHDMVRRLVSSFLSHDDRDSMAEIASCWQFEVDASIIFRAAASLSTRSITSPVHIPIASERAIEIAVISASNEEPAGHNSALCMSGTSHDSALCVFK